MAKNKLRNKFVVERVIRYISSNLEKNLSLCVLADNVAYMSPCHFHRLFKTETGESLGVFVMACRMKATAELLKSSNTSISEIASLCGFQSLSVFYRNFKKHYGTSPDIYRQKIQNNILNAS